MAAMIRNIWCVGRNYAKHATELGHSIPGAEQTPMIFLKAGSTIARETIELPKALGEIHFECELALRFGPDLHFSELTLVLDLTARDVQTQLKKDQHPWTLAKSFKNACALGPLVTIPPGCDLQNLQFQLKVNGAIRQKGQTRDMIHKVEKLRSYVVDRFPVCEGDLLLTGTPEGVAQLKGGDICEAEIPGLVQAKWRVLP